MDYKTVAYEAETEYIEKKSRFLSRIKPVKSEEEALRYIEETKSRFFDATHNVYAYVTDMGRIQRFSDDGEPHGTAGKPTLNILIKEGLSGAVIVTTRYFGGILLGAGGLVRAYAKSAKDALDKAGIAVMIKVLKVEISVPYTLYKQVENEVLLNGGIIESVIYEAEVTIRLLLKQEKFDLLSERVRDISRGMSQPVISGEDYENETVFEKS